MSVDTILETPSTMRTTLDFERDGKQVGELHLPYSPHEDAWGVIPIPAAVLRNGDGPTALLVGGVHGDEYEGPIVLSELIRSLEPAQIHGRLIVVPAVNLPAVRAGRRTSPIDDLNLARAFPGDPAGTPTRQIAHYVARELVARADFVLDLHSGGTSLEIMTVAMLRRHDDAALDGRTEAAMRSFGTSLALSAAPGEGRTLIAAAAAQAKVTFAVELGYGGMVSAAALSIARAGVAGFLAHTEILPGAVAPYDGPLWEVADPSAYVLAPVGGVFEPFQSLGAEVVAGQEAGRIHHLDRPAQPPTPVHFANTGLMFARRAPGIVAHGNCVGVVASPAKS